MHPDSRRPSLRLTLNPEETVLGPLSCARQWSDAPTRARRSSCAAADAQAPIRKLPLRRWLALGLVLVGGCTPSGRVPDENVTVVMEGVGDTRVEKGPLLEAVDGPQTEDAGLKPTTLASTPVELVAFREGSLSFAPNRRGGDGSAVLLAGLAAFPLERSRPGVVWDVASLRGLPWRDASLMDGAHATMAVTREDASGRSELSGLWAIHEGMRGPDEHFVYARSAAGWQAIRNRRSMLEWFDVDARPYLTGHVTLRTWHIAYDPSLEGASEDPTPQEERRYAKLERELAASPPALVWNGAGPTPALPALPRVSASGDEADLTGDTLPPVRLAVLAPQQPAGAASPCGTFLVEFGGLAYGSDLGSSVRCISLAGEVSAIVRADARSGDRYLIHGWQETRDSSSVIAWGSVGTESTEPWLGRLEGRSWTALPAPPSPHDTVVDYAISQEGDQYAITAAQVDFGSVRHTRLWKLAANAEAGAWVELVLPSVEYPEPGFDRWLMSDFGPDWELQRGRERSARGLVQLQVTGVRSSGSQIYLIATDPRSAPDTAPRSFLFALARAAPAQAQDQAPSQSAPIFLAPGLRIDEELARDAGTASRPRPLELPRDSMWSVVAAEDQLVPGSVLPRECGLLWLKLASADEDQRIGAVEVARRAFADLEEDPWPIYQARRGTVDELGFVFAHYSVEIALRLSRSLAKQSGHAHELRCAAPHVVAQIELDEQAVD